MRWSVKCDVQCLICNLQTVTRDEWYSVSGARCAERGVCSMLYGVCGVLSAACCALFTVCYVLCGVFCAVCDFRAPWLPEWERGKA